MSIVLHHLVQAVRTTEKGSYHFWLILALKENDRDCIENFNKNSETITPDEWLHDVPSPSQTWLWGIGVEESFRWV